MTRAFSACLGGTIAQVFARASWWWRCYSGCGELSWAAGERGSVETSRAPAERPARSSKSVVPYFAVDLGAVPVGSGVADTNLNGWGIVVVDVSDG
jgi:hypothetical protein